MSELDHTQPKRSVAGRFFSDVFRMPGWQKGLLGVFLAIGAAGVAGQVYSKLAPPPTDAVVKSNTEISTPAPGDAPSTPGKSFVGGKPQSPTSPQTTGTEPTAPTPAQTTWLAEHAPGLTRTGLGFIGAFIVGWAFRVFIKTMALVTVLGASLLMGLSYFKVLNVDFSRAEQEYKSASAWLWDQATHLKDAAIAHLPASTSGAIGLFVGLRKK